MDIHVSTCVQSVYHPHAHMILDGHASIDDIYISLIEHISNVCEKHR